MKVSAEIAPADLKELQKFTGETTKSLAIIKALSEFLREHKKRELIQRALEGQTDYSMSNDELERLELHDPHPTLPR